MLESFSLNMQAHDSHARFLFLSCCLPKIPIAIAMAHFRAPFGRRVATKACTPLLLAGVLCPVLFSLPQRAERRSPIPPRHALTVEREIPLADVADPAEISVDDENRLRVQAGLPGNNVVALTTPADLAEVLDRVTKTHQVLVVDYYAPWCRACQKLLRYVHKIAREPKFQNVEFATVDFDRSEDLVKSRQVDRLPTMEIYNGKDLKQRWSGANTKKFLERLETEVDESVPQDVMSG